MAFASPVACFIVANVVWRDATRAGMQVYRIEAGKLAETWLMFQPPGSAWTDAVAQEHWKSAPPASGG